MNKQNISKILLIFSDFFLIFISFILSINIINYFIGEITSYLPNNQIDDRVLIHFSLSCLTVIYFWIKLRHYTYRKPLWYELKEIIFTLIIFSIIELSIIAFSKSYFSRYLWGITWICAVILVPFGRIFVKYLLIKLGWYIKETIIIGNGKNALDAYNAITSEPYLGLNIKYFITSNNDEHKHISHLNIPIIEGKDNQIWNLISQEKDFQFILALENNENDSLDFWLRELARKNCRSVSVIPTLRGLPLYSTDMTFIFSYEVMLLRINNNLAKLSSRILKRTMDIIGSITIITLLSPLLLMIYFIIKKDGGNAIYGHTRIGRNGKAFSCLKFRSMVVNSKEVLEHLLATDPIAKAEWEKDFKLKNDPRITPIGHFLRKTSLDELPQLFNVLKGEMSLVGPRPIVKEELERYQQDIDYYFMAKPGMTGLWQVSGRNDVDYEMRVYFDAWYVKNWSLWNDIAILFKTIEIVLKRKGAY
ncbi:undecaprenyl-phosphate galactose phosphotransferase [Volucribacter psittacicida]|uniref:Undecaprenyl-phosphate galactose phosphotransferase n=1 Tax=Volucribacter psittacicida TaxID=203482 RepID=A0A4R1FRQ2_9PAST|nr:undecaprenyl-phosphate galactose phosphotransferase WbaP [Volucribacter psittacicida]TCJ97986.1 undecaprenyl-phosphate galactose phosphotransferase [Volucribacter psittacicida]